LLSRDIGPFGQTFLHHGTTNENHDQAQVESNDLSQQTPDLSSIVAIETVQVERLTHFQAPAQSHVSGLPVRLDAPDCKTRRDVQRQSYFAEIGRRGFSPLTVGFSFLVTTGFTGLQ
jgi:hypothetical protein